MLTALRRRRGPDDGFTLVEVLVALTLLALAMAAIVPLLAISGSAAVASRKHTIAKNLTQERLEAMRQLPYQVDHQNGPFIDLLDNYYPNLAAATGSGVGWVASAATNRIAGEPTTGSYYRTRVDTVADQPGFSQVVAVQYLDLARAPLADTRFATYRHDMAGLDGAPSTLLGVTVLTSWTHQGKAQSFRVFTQIGDAGGIDGLLTSQASAVLLRLESALADGAAVTSEALSVTSDGRLSDGSVASVRAVTGRATRTGVADLIATSGESIDPPTCTGSGCPNPQPGSVSAGAVPSSSTCADYATFGRSEASGLTSTAAGGRPRVPATVSTVSTDRTSAFLLKESGAGCGAFSFNNTSGLSDPLLSLEPTLPVVQIAGDSSTTGNTKLASSEIYLDATAEETVPKYVRAGAKTLMPLEDRHIRILPTAFALQGVLRVRLHAAEILCDSSTAAPIASYTVSVLYWNGSTYAHLAGNAAITWSSSTAFTNPFAGMDLTQKVVQYEADGTTPKRTLANYLAAPPSLATALTAGSTNGVASIGDAVLSLTTVPTRAPGGTPDPASSVGVKIGKVSCVAVDER